MQIYRGTEGQNKTVLAEVLKNAREVLFSFVEVCLLAAQMYLDPIRFLTLAAVLSQTSKVTMVSIIKTEEYSS